MEFRLKEKYKNTIKPQLIEELKRNVMTMPALEKVVISVGAGDASKDTKLMQNHSRFLL
jgi:large subunit ribosomal protein L5